MYIFDEKEIESRMSKSFEAFEHHLGSIRTGRASSAFLEDVRIEVYDSKMSLKELANISILDNFTLSVRPWDTNLTNQIGRAIQEAGLGVNPIVESAIIRVPLPKMTEDRRKEMVKIAHNYGEETKVALRNIRHDENHRIEKAEKDKEISEDDMHRFREKVQKIIDQFTKKVDESVKRKSSEIMDI